MKKTDRIREYLAGKDWLDEIEKVEFLAAGEYNENYLVEARGGRYVFRINHGSQLDLDNQIEYEFQVLQAVEPSGVTPKVFFVDPDAEGFDDGVLLMQYLEGRALNYPLDIGRAARVFSRIHALPVQKGLIEQLNPVRDIAEESCRLINRYPDHPLISEKVQLLRYHEKILSLAENTEPLFSNEPLCIVNTEVNSENFVVQDDAAFLLDWEKAVVSVRYQDLGHFVVPTTTLWKSNYVYSEDEKFEFLKTYKQESALDLNIKDLFEKTKILERTILLRALSWCFMAYFEYTSTKRELRNEQTFEKMRGYLNDIDCFLTW